MRVGKRGLGRIAQLGGTVGVLPLLLMLGLLLSASLSACASSIIVSRTSDGGAQPGVTGMTPTGQGSGNWQTVANLTGAAASSGGGNSTSIDSSSFVASGPYQILAACQGSGSLAIDVSGQGSMTFKCTASRNAPTRVAGSDASGSGDTIDVVVTTQGSIEWYQVLAQVQG